MFVQNQVEVSTKIEKNRKTIKKNRTVKKNRLNRLEYLENQTESKLIKNRTEKTKSNQNQTH
jgi:hypothetical protein